jgi:hypothetical protein
MEHQGLGITDDQLQVTCKEPPNLTKVPPTWAEMEASHPSPGVRTILNGFDKFSASRRRKRRSWLSKAKGQALAQNEGLQLHADPPYGCRLQQLYVGYRN